MSLTTTTTTTYTEPAALELAFVAWLETQSASVEWRYERCLFDNNRDYDDRDFCATCVEVQRYVERHKKTGLTRIDGWDEAHESDSPKWCERCGVLLWHSLTEDGANNEIKGWLDNLDADVSAQDAAIMHNFLDGNGEYSGYTRAKWWPIIEPIARRYCG